MATILEYGNSCTNFLNQLADQIVDYYTSYNNLHMTTSKLENTRLYLSHYISKEKIHIHGTP